MKAYEKDEDEDLRVKKLIGEITKLLPERSKIKTDLLYFKYAPILVMLMRWYGVSQFYDNKMEITLWYEENEEPVWFFYFITYILYPISLWKGQVVSVSNPQTKYPTFNNGFTPQPMETVVDVKVKLGDEEVDFKQLPANGQIANDKNLVVSDNKDAMSAEVDAMLRQSKAILESVDYNKMVVESCEGMLQQLNPR